MMSAKQFRVRDPRRAEDLARLFERAAHPKAIVPRVELALRIDDSRHVTAVKDYAEASGIVSELVNQHMEMGQGNSTFPRMTVVDLSTGSTVAHVSWNGKVWPGEQWTPDAKPIYEPGRGCR
jgi:hypothetical protein